MKAPDIVGQKFGRLYVFRRADRKTDYEGMSLWECVCDCGRTGTFSAHTMRQGKTKSCGCLKSERIAESNRRRAKNVGCCGNLP